MNPVFCNYYENVMVKQNNEVGGFGNTMSEAETMLLIQGPIKSFPYLR